MEEVGELTVPRDSPEQDFMRLHKSTNDVAN